jgi:arsenate reductase
MKTVLFACVHNAGRSQMAAGLFNQLVDPTKARAVSAGTEPGARVHPVVVDVMRELGVDLEDAVPQKLTEELAAAADLLVTMGCGEACPVVPGVERDDWPLPDPNGQPVEYGRQVRDEVGRRVRTLLDTRGWLRQRKLLLEGVVPLLEPGLPHPAGKVTKVTGEEPLDRRWLAAVAFVGHVFGLWLLGHRLGAAETRANRVAIGATVAAVGAAYAVVGAGGALVSWLVGHFLWSGYLARAVLRGDAGFRTSASPARGEPLA